MSAHMECDPKLGLSLLPTLRLPTRAFGCQDVVSLPTKRSQPFPCLLGSGLCDERSIVLLVYNCVPQPWDYHNRNIWVDFSLQSERLVMFWDRLQALANAPWDKSDDGGKHDKGNADHSVDVDRLNVMIGILAVMAVRTTTTSMTFIWLPSMAVAIMRMPVNLTSRRR